MLIPTPVNSVHSVKTATRLAAGKTSKRLSNYMPPADLRSWARMRLPIASPVIRANLAINMQGLLPNVSLATQVISSQQLIPITFSPDSAAIAFSVIVLPRLTGLAQNSTIRQLRFSKALTSVSIAPRATPFNSPVRRPTAILATVLISSTHPTLITKLPTSHKIAANAIK